MDEVVLTVRNRHLPSCGVPGPLETEDDVYTGYFENQHGEQALFRMHRPTGRAWVILGDADWSDQHPVAHDGSVPGLLLGDAEADWVRLCWRTSRVAL